MSEQQWFHSINLGNGTVTAGEVDHCSTELATNRFGIPGDLTGKSVLDVGCASGYFSFECERRGANMVRGIEPNHDRRNQFAIAQASLGSEAWLVLPETLSEYVSDPYYNRAADFEHDLVLLFGVLYHTKEPLTMLEQLYTVVKPGGIALVETAIGDGPGWSFRPGYDNDPTNYWYPSVVALHQMLFYVGFSRVEDIWTDGIRASVRCYK